MYRKDVEIYQKGLICDFKVLEHKFKRLLVLKNWF